MEPGEALGLAAQVAVTLAGFAGVVVVFRPASVHQWSSLDRFRLRLLLSNSILPLAYSVIAIFLLTIKPPPESTWRWCSGALICQIPFAIFNFKAARGLTQTEFKGVSRMLFFPLFGIGIMTISFFAGIVVHLITAMLQFMRLVLLPQGNQPAA